MKLYMHPASTTCRPILLFAADSDIKLDQQIVDIMAGEQHKPEFQAVNPNSCVPVLEDGSLRLPECSAILKYLADKVGSPAYPKDLAARAQVNAAMDWFNTGFYRTFGYGVIYAQVLPFMKLADPTGQAQAVAAGKQGAERFFGVLDQHMLGGGRPYVCGQAITIADYQGSAYLSIGELTGCSFAAYPNVRAWYDRMKSRPNWAAANAGLSAWAEHTKAGDYVRM